MQDRSELLLHYLRGVRLRWEGFRPGRVDCANFAHGWFRLVTGTDLRARLGIEYATLEEGKRLLKNRGFEDLAALAASVMPEIVPAEGAPGDIVAFRAEGDLALGILGGPQIHALSLEGLTVTSRCHAVRVFRP